MNSLPCEKCNDTGWYMYDEIHSTVCDMCCTHEEGWWELTKGYANYKKGADNRCCMAGCGRLYRDIKKVKNKKKS